jgi:hypothetical protein
MTERKLRLKGKIQETCEGCEFHDHMELEESVSLYLECIF